MHSPLREADVMGLQQSVGLRLPADLAGFLRRYNGMRLFRGGIVLYGLRRHYRRDAEGILGHPFCIVTPNTRERPPFLGDEDWVAGTYKSKTLVVGWQGGVALVGRRGDRLECWGTIAAFLADAIARSVSF